MLVEVLKHVVGAVLAAVFFFFVALERLGLG